MECLDDGEYTKKGDIWQLGLLFCQIITLDFPLAGGNAKSVKRRINDMNFDELFEDLSLEFNPLK